MTYCCVSRIGKRYLVATSTVPKYRIKLISLLLHVLRPRYLGIVSNDLLVKVDRMAEAILVVGLLASSSQLIEYSAVVIKRLHDFMTNVKDLPPYFSHINNQLPILVGIVDSLRKRVSSGDFTLQSEHDLKRVVDALDEEIKGLDAVLCKILPSARASTWEKGVKAVKSVSAQKSVENFASVIQDYVTSLNAFQITHTSDQIKTIISSIEE